MLSVVIRTVFEVLKLPAPFAVCRFGRPRKFWTAWLLQLMRTFRTDSRYKRRRRNRNQSAKLRLMQQYANACEFTSFISFITVSIARSSSYQVKSWNSHLSCQFVLYLTPIIVSDTQESRGGTIGLTWLAAQQDWQTVPTAAASYCFPKSLPHGIC